MEPHQPVSFPSMVSYQGSPSPLILFVNNIHVCKNREKKKGERGNEAKLHVHLYKIHNN